MQRNAIVPTHVFVKQNKSGSVITVCLLRRRGRAIESFTAKHGYDDRLVGVRRPKGERHRSEAEATWAIERECEKLKSRKLEEVRARFEDEGFDPAWMSARIVFHPEVLDDIVSTERERQRIPEPQPSIIDPAKRLNDVIAGR